MSRAAWADVFAVMGALAGAGVSRVAVYGLYPATVPLIVASARWLCWGNQPHLGG